jgi:hypothetical protein
MPASNSNRAWNLEAFLDSLAVELDRAQQTLALKAVNQKLLYTVKDVALDLQCFPSFDGDVVKFTTARPGETGASKITIQLGSVTDTLVKDMSRDRYTEDDVSLDDLDDIDRDTKKSLEKIGVHTAKDLERMERKKIDVGKAVGKTLDYGALARRIAQAKRHGAPPAVNAVSMDARGQLRITGKNLAPVHEPERFPFATLDGKQIAVTRATDEELHFDVGAHAGAGDLKVALDPFAVMQMRINT